MSHRAAISPRYRWRPGVFALMALVFGGWFLYDGYVKYPGEQEIFEHFERFRQEGRSAEWPDFAGQRNWPVDEKNLSGLEHTKTDIFWQKVFGFALLGVGGWYGIVYLRTHGRWIDADEQGLVTSWGKRVPFDAIATINLDRWQSHGVAVIQYEEAGRRRRLVLDDWKYDQPATQALLKLVQEKCGAVQSS